MVKKHAARRATRILKATHDLVFQRVHGSNLIYNAAWEDPRIDTQLMKLDAASEVVMITSAGCNVLDYLIEGPAAIHSIDVNYRQNALLELKMALFHRGDFADLFEMFGIGSHAHFRRLYAGVRNQLTDQAATFWDKKITFFNPESMKKSFYYHGGAGIAAWVMGKALFKAKPNIKNFAMSLLDAGTLDEQREAYELLEPEIWGKFSNWLVRQPMIMTLLGVPRPQIKLIEDSYPGGLTAYIKDKLRHVMTELPIRDNYFWRAYITGSYTVSCCPRYLKRDNFDVIRDRLDRVHPHTSTLASFLKQNPAPYSHYVLLDHQDWLAWNDPEALAEEWDLILANSRPGTKVLMRSAGLDLSFVPEFAKARLRFMPDVTEPLHMTDRVGTYGSLHFAEVL